MAYWIDDDTNKDYIQRLRSLICLYSFSWVPVFHSA
jgi:hypothetical protein